MATVQIAILAGLPYTALRDAVLTHPTLVEGLTPLFASMPSTKFADANVERIPDRACRDHVVTAPERVA